MKKIIDKKTGETFMGELWIAEIKDGKRELKVELKTEDDADRYDVEDSPEEKKYGGRAPKAGDEYWVVYSNGVIESQPWEDKETDGDLFECGSAFWTEEEAEKELARREAYVILKEDTKGFKPDWGNDTYKYVVTWTSSEGGRLFTEGVCSLCNSRLCFATKEDSEASIEAHEKEWKTWLGVEG